MTHDEPATDDVTYRLLDRPLGPADLEERAARVARTCGDDAERGACAMVFELGGERFAIDAADVGCVRPPTAVHPIPHRTNDIMRGLCNIDGELLLCMNLASLLNINAAAGDELGARFVVIGSEQSRWAFGVDSVIGMFSYPASALQPLPLTVGEDHRHYGTRIVQLGDFQATCLDVERIAQGFEAALR